ncbi:MAG: IS30 family transposase, partial [Candidatus Liptonbacteria bacterium]|nr:IS30 family transposase [Candidatus Liptonbacteria bacterium]
FPELRTLTTDNDILFRHHARLAALLHVRIFFCHPYHAWEKGSIENVNRAIRRDVPKGSSIAHYSKKFMANLEAKLNRRPMEVLQYWTPAEMLGRYRKRIANNKKRAGARCKRVS